MEKMVVLVLVLVLKASEQSEVVVEIDMGGSENGSTIVKCRLDIVYIPYPFRISASLKLSWEPLNE